MLTGFKSCAYTKYACMHIMLSVIVQALVLQQYMAFTLQTSSSRERNSITQVKMCVSTYTQAPWTKRVVEGAYMYRARRYSVT